MPPTQCGSAARKRGVPAVEPGRRALDDALGEDEAGDEDTDQDDEDDVA
ncbi:MAG: hypothetical protein ACRCYU_03700 [Nocardioides sp.]